MEKVCFGRNDAASFKVISYIALRFSPPHILANTQQTNNDLDKHHLILEIRIPFLNIA